MPETVNLDEDLVEALNVVMGTYKIATYKEALSFVIDNYHNYIFYNYK